MRSRLARVCGLALLLFVVAACGIKASPRPPLEPEPVPEAAVPDPMDEGLPAHDAADILPEEAPEDDEAVPDLLELHDDDPFLI